MNAPRVFVSYTTSVQRDRRRAARLIQDLRDAGADVVTLDETSRDAREGKERDQEEGRVNNLTHVDIVPATLVEQLNRQLTNCDWLLLVQTREALLDSQVQLAVNTALTLVMQQRMRGIFSVIAAQVEPDEIPPTWTTFVTFDATHDYHRALLRILLKLNLPVPETWFAAKTQVAPPPTVHPAPRAGSTLAISNDKPVITTRTPLRPSWLTSRRLWSIPLALALFLVLSTTLVLLMRALPTHGSSGRSVQSPSSPSSASNTNKNATQTALALSPQSLYDRTIQQRPVIDDTLTSQDANDWRVATVKGGSCGFLNGMYQVQAVLTNTRITCPTRRHAFHNVLFQAQMSVQGKGPCGLVFYEKSNPFYADIINIFSNGSYQLLVQDPTDGKTHQQAHGQTTIDPRASNKIAVIVLNHTIYVYINTQFVVSGRDDNASDGRVGMQCRDATETSTATFSSAQVWKL